MDSAKIYGPIILLFSFMFLVYLTVANVNILLSNGVPALYPYLNELFFSPWVYTVVPIMLGEILILGIVVWYGWNKMNPPPPPPLEEIEKIAFDKKLRKESKK